MPRPNAAQRDKRHEQKPPAPAPKTPGRRRTVAANKKHGTGLSHAELNEILGLFLGAVGLGAFLIMPLKYGLITLTVALALVATRLRGTKRLVMAVAAVGALAGVCIAFITAGHAPSARERQLAIGQTRLAIVNRFNALRVARGVQALNFDAQLSALAQEQAHDAVATYAGLPHQMKRTPSPAEATNMWAEMFGTACSWQRLFELDGLTPTGEKPPPSDHMEIGFVTGGANARSGPALSPDFHAVGVGVDYYRRAISVAIQLVGPFKRGEPSIPSLPNIVTVVSGNKPLKCK